MTICLISFFLVCNLKLNGNKCSGKVHSVKLDGEEFVFFDTCNSTTVINQTKNILFDDEYKLANVKFEPGDVLIDIGGNIGVFSIPLARKYPFVKIYAFEPVKEVYEKFEKNIKANNISEGIITLVNNAISKDGGIVKMISDGRESWVAAMSTVFHDQKWLGHNPLYRREEYVQSINITEIFRKYRIGKCKLFKIDCEGCEYESLLNTADEVFEKIEVFRGEFHDWHELNVNNYNSADLYDFVKRKKIKDVDVVCWHGCHRKHQKKKRRVKRMETKTEL